MEVTQMYIYADNAATTKTSQAAIKAMNECMEDFYGNPSSLHSVGQRAAEKLLQARMDVAECLGADFKEIYFTSGGSEADNQAIVSAATFGAKKGKKHIISTKIEHHAVLHTLAKLEKQGFEVTLLDVNEKGEVDPKAVEDAIREDTALVSIMYANKRLVRFVKGRELSSIQMQFRQLDMLILMLKNKKLTCYHYQLINSTDQRV